MVKACNVKQSTDGTGCWRDNVVAERLWRSVNYQGCTSKPTKASAPRGSG